MDKEVGREQNLKENLALVCFFFLMGCVILPISLWASVSLSIIWISQGAGGWHIRALWKYFVIMNHYTIVNLHNNYITDVSYRKRWKFKDTKLVNSNLGLEPRLSDSYLSYTIILV